MKRGSLLTASVLLSILAGGTLAGQSPLQVQLSPAIGGAFFLTAPPARFALQSGAGEDRVVTNGSFGHSYALGGSVGVRVADRGVVEGVLFWVPTELTAEGGVESGRAGVDIYMYTANFLFLLPHVGRVEPFLSLGLGGERRVFALPEVDSHTDFMWSFGPGATLSLSERLGVRLDLKDCITSFNSHLGGAEDEASHDLMLLAGLNYRIPLGRR